MSFAAGLLGGIADGVNARKEREQRQRELSVMEAMATARGQEPYSAGSAMAESAAGGMLRPTAFNYDGAISDRPAHAYNRFVSAGLPAHVAAGLVGNLMQESGANINPAAVGDNGNAFGAGQWNGPRRKAYFSFAKSRGVDPTDFDTQIDWLMHEGATSESGAWKRIMGAQTAEDAALIASKHFWRPGMPHNEARMGYARKVYSTLGASPAAKPAAAPAPETDKPPAWAWFHKRANGGAQ